MAFAVYTHSLSAIVPVKLVYKYNTEEALIGSFASLKGDFAYYKHEALKNFKDAALSKKTCLILTDAKTVGSVFEKAKKTINIGQISGTMFLKVGTKFITQTNNTVFVGGTGKPILMTVVPMENGLVELRVNRTKWIEVDKTYPYTARLTEDVVDGPDLQYRQFEVEYSEGLISFKVKVPEGFRFLSYGVDNTIRGVGLELNDSIVNPYHFKAEYKTREVMNYNYTPDEKEVKYYNDLFDQEHKTDLELKQTKDTETNLLISCPTSELSKADEVVINIASLKTNYSPAGTFTPSI